MNVRFLIRNILQYVDKNRNGVIDPEEVQYALSMGIPVQAGQTVEQVVREVENKNIDIIEAMEKVNGAPSLQVVGYDTISNRKMWIG